MNLRELLEFWMKENQPQEAKHVGQGLWLQMAKDDFGKQYLLVYRIEPMPISPQDAIYIMQFLRPILGDGFVVKRSHKQSGLRKLDMKRVNGYKITWRAAVEQVHDG